MFTFESCRFVEAKKYWAFEQGQKENEILRKALDDANWYIRKLDRQVKKVGATPV